MQTYAYQPKAQHFKPCGTCGEPTFPFPDKASTVCSWCWYVADRLKQFDAIRTQHGFSTEGIDE